MRNTAEDFYSNTSMSVITGIPEEYETTSIDEELDGIALLVDMAKKGKIDPWNIDIIDVTNKYLIQMAENQVKNLINTGRTIWLASVLLRLKSNVIVGIDNFDYDTILAESAYDENYDDNIEDFIPEPVKKSNVISLDEALKRRLSTRLNRNRTVTLQDLIKQLKFYEELDKKQALKNKLERAKKIRSYENLTPQDIVNLAHEEYIDKSIERLKVKLEHIFDKRERVDLDDLTEVGMDRISAYIALLFLSADSDIELTQNEFYGKLYVQKEAVTA